MDAFGSDRKLSELGLDLPDFPDPVMDPAELFPTVHHAAVSPIVTASDRVRHISNTGIRMHLQQQQQQNSHQVDQFQQHHQHRRHHHHHQQQQQQHETTSPDDQLEMSISSRSTMHIQNDQLTVDCHDHYGLHHADNCSELDDDYDAEFKLIDVVDDDDEVVLDSGWLDKIFDNDPPRSSHVRCADDDVIGSQHVSDEHSYSLSNGSSDLEYAIKMESDEMDMDTEIFEMINPDLTLITNSDIQSSLDACSDNYSLDTTPSLDYGSRLDDDIAGEATIIKTEPLDPSSTDSSYALCSNQSSFYDTINLPLTPPSTSGSSSDSEAGGLSPHHSPPSSPYHDASSPPPPRTHHMMSSGHGYHGYSHRDQGSIGGSQHSVWTNQQPFFTSPISSSGVLMLSEEEKRTLVAEGYPVPSKLPLTKQEEKNLKKIRRKIKNKISAQESRRKKKEYLETLEKKVECVSIENINLRKKLDLLESNNRSLMSQLQKLQSVHKVSSSMQSAVCISVN